MDLPSRATIVEVGPRDGLQSLGRVYDTELKAALIQHVLETGIREVEATSFVHPKVVPQLADAEDLMGRLPRPAGVRFRGLVPNRKGAERAVAAGVDVLVGLLSASETYSRRNQGMTVEEGLEALSQVAEVAGEAGIPWLPTISMAFFSPWEGDVPVERVIGLVERVLPMGPEEVSLAATTGIEGPGTVARVCRALRERWPDLPVALHLHDAGGMGLAAALAGLLEGVTSFDASICGIGGGIVLSDHAGNVATEDLASMLSDLGVDTGVDPAKAVRAARDVSTLLELGRTGRTASAGTPDEVLERYGQER